MIDYIHKLVYTQLQPNCKSISTVQLDFKLTYLISNWLADASIIGHIPSLSFVTIAIIMTEQILMAILQLG